MINARDMKIKTRAIHNKFLDMELQAIENKCLETATNEANKGAVFHCDLEFISREACKVLKENYYEVEPIVDEGKTTGYRVRWDT